MVVLLAIAFGLSTNRRAINPRTVFGALAIQFLLGVVALYWGAGNRALEAMSNAVQVIIDASEKGIEFLFGPVLSKEGLVFAFQVLPVIIFFAALTSVLYHWRISPDRRHEVAQFGIRAVLAGTLANLMNATIAGILIG